MKVKLEDIARAVGITAPSVSRILNDKAGFNVTPETRELVKRKAAELGYHPNVAARALSTGKTNSVALIVDMVSSGQFLGDIIQRLSAHLKECGLDLLVSLPNDQIISKVDALIAWEQVNWIREKIESSALRGTVAVPIGHGFPKYFNEGVDMDMTEIVETAMRHLFDQGRRRPLMLHHIACDQWEQWEDFAHRGYKKVFQDNGVEAPCLELPVGDKLHYKKEILEYLKGKPLPDAFFCRYDDIAIGLSAALDELGAKVPADTSIVSFDGTDNCIFNKIPLSAIEKPIDEICSTAVKLLQRRLRNPDAPKSIKRINPNFVIRQSSDLKYAK